MNGKTGNQKNFLIFHLQSYTWGGNKNKQKNLPLSKAPGFSFLTSMSFVFHQKMLLEIFSGKGSVQYQDFFCFFWCMAELLYNDGAEAAQRLSVLSGHMVLAH